MPTQENESISHTFGAGAHVIMSDGLDLDLGVEREITQLLNLGDNRFICSVKRIKAYRDTGEMAWEFDIEVPGVDFTDLLDSGEITLSYDDAHFLLNDEYEINLPDMATTIITFSGKRIVNNHE